MPNDILHRRPDGSYVISRNGLPYHVIQADPLFSQVDLAASGRNFPAEPPPATPASRSPRYSKVQLFAAMTDAEYAVFEQVQQQQPARERAIFVNATEIDAADPLFPKFEGLMLAAYGQPRAQVLLQAAKL